MAICLHVEIVFRILYGFGPGWGQTHVWCIYWTSQEVPQKLKGLELCQAIMDQIMFFETLNSPRWTVKIVSCCMYFLSIRFLSFYHSLKIKL